MEGRHWGPLLLVAFLLGVCGFVGVMPTATASQPLDELEGNGTAEDPYVITTIDELQLMENDLAAHYVLGDDVDASTTSDWNGGAGFDPVGNTSTGFAGTFDGNGHVIENLTIDRGSTDQVGLFGVVESGGTVTSVSVENAAVTGNKRTGPLAGRVRGTVTDSSASGTVTGYNNVGGLVGANRGGTINRTNASTSVDGTGGDVGGLVGYGDSGLISNSYATGTVTGEKWNVGGLVGRFDGTTEHSYATGNVIGETNDVSYVGGLLGRIDDGTIEGSYATGSVSGTGTHGGLVGVTNNADVIDAYWDANTTRQGSSAGGTKLTTAEMTGDDTASNMSGFDFDSTWVPTDGYPHLATEVTALELTLHNTTAEVGDTMQATVTLSLTGSSTIPATTTATYTSSDETVATMADDGSIDAVGAGTSRLTADLAGRTDSVTLTVESTDSGGGGGGGPPGGDSGVDNNSGTSANDSETDANDSGTGSDDDSGTNADEDSGAGGDDELAERNETRDGSGRTDNSTDTRAGGDAGTNGTADEGAGTTGGSTASDAGDNDDRTDSLPVFDDSIVDDLSRLGSRLASTVIAGAGAAFNSLLLAVVVGLLGWMLFAVSLSRSGTLLSVTLLLTAGRMAVTDVGGFVESVSGTALPIALVSILLELAIAAVAFRCVVAAVDQDRLQSRWATVGIRALVAVLTIVVLTDPLHGLVGRPGALEALGWGVYAVIAGLLVGSGLLLVGNGDELKPRLPVRASEEP